MPSFICHAIAKVFIDQLIQAPILLAFIILGMGLMQGEGIGELQEDLQKQYMSTLIANCKCGWIPADTYGGNGDSYCLVSERYLILIVYLRETLDSGNHCQYCLYQTDHASHIRQSRLFYLDHFSFHNVE
jgi:hypothetical protein